MFLLTSFAWVIARVEVLVVENKELTFLPASSFVVIKSVHNVLSH